MKFFTEQQLATYASHLVRKKRFRVFALYGDLGSGKTTFVRACAKTVGLPRLTSPTFVLMQIYTLYDQPFQTFCHVDAWRIHDSNELIDIGFLEYRDDPNVICFIEWADRIAELLPKKRMDIFFSVLSPSIRGIRTSES